jgi:hypothetical protein
LRGTTRVADRERRVVIGDHGRGVHFPNCLSGESRGFSTWWRVVVAFAEGDVWVLGFAERGGDDLFGRKVRERVEPTTRTEAEGQGFNLVSTCQSAALPER